MTILERIEAHEAAHRAVPTVMITVRVPKDLRERLNERAWRNKTSVNVICNVALEQASKELEPDYVEG